MKKIITLTIFASILSGCDSVYKALDKPKKGTLDAVAFCIEENSNKEGLLTVDEINLACIKKHQLYSSKSPTEGCSATVYLVPKGGVSRVDPSDLCINTTDSIITKIEAEIMIRNLKADKNVSSRSYTETAKGESNPVWIMPNGTLNWSIVSFEKYWRDQVTDNLPYCSKKLDVPCKSWRFTGYHYLKINI